MTAPLSVTFVLPSFVPSGGAQVVFRHAAATRARGHRVQLLGVPPPPAFPFGREGLLPFRRWLYYRFFSRIPRLLDRYGIADCAREVPHVGRDTVPNADLIVATSFETAEWIGSLPDSTGHKLYFLQDYEAWTPHLEARVDATWRMPFVRLAVSRWLMEFGRVRLGVDSRGPIGNGVDARRFHPPRSPRSGAVPVVGAVYDERGGKGADVLREALARIQTQRPEARLLVFGRHRPRHPLPPGTRYVLNPTWDRIPRLYRSMDVFVHASVREGWGLPPMGAMASGAAVVATPVGGVPEFTDETSACLVPPGDAHALSEAALELLASPERRETMGRAARRKVEPLGWEKICGRFVDELEHSARSGR